MIDIDHRALLKRYLRHLIEQYGEDYFDEALHIADAYPELPPHELGAFQILADEVMAERRGERNLIRRGIC